MIADTGNGGQRMPIHRSEIPRFIRMAALVLVVVGIAVAGWHSVPYADLFHASDPGVRGGPA